MIITKLICRSGISLSVGCSESHYCTPKVNFGPYTSVELSQIETYEPKLIAYVDGTANFEDLESNVYATVPVKIVQKLIKKHGGLKEEPGLIFSLDKDNNCLVREKVDIEKITKLMKKAHSFLGTYKVDILMNPSYQDDKKNILEQLEIEIKRYRK